MNAKPLSCRILMPLVAISILLAAFARAETAPIKLDVDATDAPRNLLHARLEIPVQPGSLTLRYPKWIPGDHEPDGPITDLVGLVFTAHGKPLEWHRDPDDMFAFHLEIPAGVDMLEVSLDFLMPGSGAYSAGASSTDKLLDLSWHYVVLYPDQPQPLAFRYAASLRLPEHWQFGTALPVAHASASRPFRSKHSWTLRSSPANSSAPSNSHPARSPRTSSTSLPTAPPRSTSSLRTSAT